MIVHKHLHRACVHHFIGKQYPQWKFTVGISQERKKVDDCSLSVYKYDVQFDTFFLFQWNNNKSENGKMAITAVALQDHISRSLLHSLSLSDPVRDSLRVRGSSQRPCQKNKHANADPQHSLSQRSLEGREYVLDPAPSPLTLGTLYQSYKDYLVNNKHPCMQVQLSFIFILFCHFIETVNRWTVTVKQNRKHNIYHSPTLIEKPRFLSEKELE